MATRIGTRKRNPKGIIITEDVLRKLGAVKRDIFFDLKTPERIFRFGTIGDHWTFECVESSDMIHDHAITHLDECLGFAYADGFRAGRLAMRDEIAELLDLEVKE